MFKQVFGPTVAGYRQDFLNDGRGVLAYSYFLVPAASAVLGSLSGVLVRLPFHLINSPAAPIVSVATQGKEIPISLGDFSTKNADPVALALARQNGSELLTAIEREPQMVLNAQKAALAGHAWNLQQETESNHVFAMGAIVGAACGVIFSLSLAGIGHLQAIRRRREMQAAMAR